MAIRARRQRHGRVVHWVCGLLLLAFFGLMGLHWLNNRERQDQDEAEMERARGAQLSRDHSPADDWPQWRGANCDGIAPGEGLLAAWPAGGPPLSWKVKGGGGYSAPVVADGQLITLVQRGGDETLVCWEAETGKERWQVGYECRFTQNGVGPRAAPAIDKERVYSLGSVGRVLCVRIADGKQLWSKELTELGGKVPYWGYSSAPLVDGDLLITVPGGSNSVMAFDKKTGEEKWRANVEGHAGYSSPIVCTAAGIRQLLVFLGTELVSLDPASGKVFWKFPWETKHEVNAATPIVVKDEKSADAYVFISSNYGKGCALLRVTKGDDGAPAMKRVYKNNLMKNHFSTCVLYKDHLYGFDDGYLTCLPLLAGRPKAWTQSKFNKGSLLLAGDRLIVLGEYGNLALVEPTPEEYREQASFVVTDKLTWTMPVLAQKRLYLRDEEWLYCYDLRSK